MVLNFLIIAIIIAFDQITKYFTLINLKPIGTFPIIENIVHLTYAENTGAAFSILEGKLWFFLITTTLIVAFIIYALKKYGDINIMFRTSLIFIVGGALGNLIDRIRLGFVVDMIDFRVINYAIFNVADCFVVVGTIILGIYLVFYDKVLFSEDKK